MKAARTIWIIGLTFIFAACGGDDLEGPRRSRFEKVDVAEFEVERGKVQLFGVRGERGAIVDRWMRPRDGFQKIDELLELRRLSVKARCRSRGGCDVRYDLGLSRTARAEVELHEGELRLVKFAGPIQGWVKKGNIIGQTLSSSDVRARVEEGRVQLQFVEAPERLEVEVGRGEAVIFVPDRSYRCEFDRDSPAVRLNGLRCHQSSLRTIRVDPGEGSVRFGVIDLPD